MHFATYVLSEFSDALFIPQTMAGDKYGFSQKPYQFNKDSTIFCFAYIHTSLHAKTKNINETQIVELVDVIYKDGKKADESSGQFKIGIVSGEKTFTVADVSTKDMPKPTKSIEKLSSNLQPRILLEITKQLNLPRVIINRTLKE